MAQMNPNYYKMMDYSQQASHDANVFAQGGLSKYNSTQSNMQTKSSSRKIYPRHNSMNQPEGFVQVIDQNMARTSHIPQRVSMSPNHPRSAIERFQTPTKIVYQTQANQSYNQIPGIVEQPIRMNTDYHSREYDMNVNYRSTRNSFVNTNNQSFNELPRSNMSNTSFIDSVNYGIDQREKTASCQTTRSKEYMIEKLKSENKKLLKKMHDMKKKETSLMFGQNRANAAEIDTLRAENVNLTVELNKLKTESQNFESMVVRMRKLEAENVRLNKDVINVRNEKEHYIREVDVLKSNNEKVSAMQSVELRNVEIELMRLREVLSEEQKRTETAQKNVLRLESERKSFKMEIEKLKQECSKNAVKDTSISKMQVNISNLELENRKLTEMVHEVRLQSTVINTEREALMERNLREEIERLRNQLREECRAKDACQMELDKLKSNILRMEVEREYSQKRTTSSSDSLMPDTSKDRIAELFKMKLEEKAKENNELSMMIESLKNENQDLKCKLSEQEVLNSMQVMSQNRKDKESLELMAISNEELKLQNNFLQKESEKLKEMIKRLDANRSSKTEIYRTVHEIDGSSGLTNNPNVEAMMIKAIMSDFELFRLRTKIAKFEGEICSLVRKSDRTQNQDNTELRRLHYKELTSEDSKFLTEGGSFTMSGDNAINEYRR